MMKVKELRKMLEQYSDDDEINIASCRSNVHKYCGGAKESTNKYGRKILTFIDSDTINLNKFK